jgi:2-oxo-3-hexenedioate decarboxylase
MTIDPAALATRLAGAAADRTAIEQLTVEVPDLDLATAYRVQAELRRAAGPLAGWKLGLTSRAKQAQPNAPEPGCWPTHC